VDKPPPKLDRLALAVHGVAIVLIIGGAVGFVAALKKEVDKPRPAAKAQAPAPATTAPAPAAKDRPAKAPEIPAQIRSWRYAVQVEPQAWRDITLTYAIVSERGKPIAYADFVHAGGKARFRLGALEPGDPAHANVRFPGFFLHQAYLKPPFEKGQRVAWSWPWQPVREGRIKQFEGVVHGWEVVKVPHGSHQAARIEAKILYVEKGRVQAESRETIWIAPEVGIVKVVREGAAPDESSRRIVAELAELR